MLDLASKKIAVKQSYQTGQKWVENAKIQKFKYDIWFDFQTLRVCAAAFSLFPLLNHR